MQRSDRIGGAALIVGGAAVVIGMAHHPSGTAPPAFGEAVHAALIASLGLTAFGFSAFCALRGTARPLILAGLVSYAIAVLGHVCAGTINGFVVPALSARPEPVPGAIYLLAWETNQAFAELGAVAAGVAILLWSLDLVREGSMPVRLIGFLGLAAGAVPTALLLSGAMRMNLAGAFIAYAAHAAWGVALGFLLMRGMGSAAGGGQRPAPAEATI
jgi:hypothetical protein